MITITKALISVSDKTGLVEFAKSLTKLGVTILSTGGTLKEIEKNGVMATSVDAFTGFPEMLDGRVKTLHPKLHGGILADRTKADHLEQMKQHGLSSIELVVVNLYPFVNTVQKKGVQLEEAIENIDIGGPSLIRGAAKNHKNTVVITDVNDYALVISELEKQKGISEEFAYKMAVKAFNHTASYDAAIAAWLNKRDQIDFPETLTLTYKKKQSLRYGENPHQKAAFYEPVFTKSEFTPIQGKELSFNNMLDLDAAFHIASLLPKNSVSIIKHLNPCGIASAPTVLESFVLARKTDPVSAFGGVIGINGDVDKETALAITENFVECIIAHKYSKEALEILSKKPNIRLLEIESFVEAREEMDLRPIHHGLLLQNYDYDVVNKADLKVVSKRQPSEEDWEGLLFAWSCAKFVKSNAIVYTDTQSTLGIGAGQMSRVDSVELGAMKSQKAGLSVVGSYVGSDAFFPFRDGIDLVAKVGAKAIIQPGGSIRDEEVIQACNEHNLIMVFTGMRHFRH